METGRLRVLIMAAGTGGHVFPALSIAHALKAQGADVQWLGTPQGMENRLLASTDIPLHHVSVKGLRGAGWKRLLVAPFMIAQAFWQSLQIMRRLKPGCVVGMGGFVCGPAGVASKVLGIPLLIHEQNAVVGLTNRLLSPLADKVCEAFPGTFKASSKLVFTGNPVRKDIAGLKDQDADEVERDASFRLLVLGGSQGAQAINQVLPTVLKSLLQKVPVQCLHQTGSAQFEATCSAYRELGLELDSRFQVEPFIDDMAAAYKWADLVVCRSGASTVCEIAAAGIPAIFIPYPYHRDMQQTLNASWLSKAGAAEILQQSDLTDAELLARICAYATDREKLISSGEKGRALAIYDADTRIAELCREVANGE
ncbi:MAG: undecaprenyldiphospho-muramoylpentapeptide beta-N-acetylglucosaminyltransferase [Proteobacteria bacterium]|nr:undecaprenyldiphospho-muramoylpentapeptide beta-N-acetylglucosaminyltransferase [Pseudomonadota bacterium]MDA0926880.1 undecaprenyldiphospho-muramoylpentapeptide beta-N-acetylglucosaminyltransferase [Pseudomonadota bacterium]